VVWQCCMPFPLVPSVSLWPTRLVILGVFVLFRGMGCLGVLVPLSVVGQDQILGEAAQAISQRTRTPLHNGACSYLRKTRHPFVLGSSAQTPGFVWHPRMGGTLTAASRHTGRATSSYPKRIVTIRRGGSSRGGTQPGQITAYQRTASLAS